MLSVLDLWPTGVLFLRAESEKRFLSNGCSALCNAGAQKYCTIQQNAAHIEGAGFGFGAV